MKLLLDEMYPAALAEALRTAGVEACTAAELGLSGRSDPDLFEAAVAQGNTVLTENVGDFARISGEHVTAGRQHPGVLIALSSRFSRRIAGMNMLVRALLAIAGEQVDDRILYLQPSNHA